MYQVTTVQKDQLKLNAITDPSAINGRVAVDDIFPGQQLTQTDFTTEAPDLDPLPDHRHRSARSRSRSTPRTA